MVQIKHFTAPQKMPNFQFLRHARQNTRRPPALPENYYESKQTYFSYSLDKAFHSPEFQAKLFFTRFLLRQPLKTRLILSRINGPNNALHLSRN